MGGGGGRRRGRGRRRLKGPGPRRPPGRRRAGAPPRRAPLLHLRGLGPHTRRRPPRHTHAHDSQRRRASAVTLWPVGRALPAPGPDLGGRRPQTRQASGGPNPPVPEEGRGPAGGGGPEDGPGGSGPRAAPWSSSPGEEDRGLSLRSDPGRGRAAFRGSGSCGEPGLLAPSWRPVPRFYFDKSGHVWGCGLPVGDGGRCPLLFLGPQSSQQPEKY